MLSRAQVYLVNDTDDDGSHRRAGIIENLARATALIENQNSFAPARPDTVQGDDIGARGFAILIKALSERVPKKAGR